MSNKCWNIKYGHWPLTQELKERDGGINKNIIYAFRAYIQQPSLFNSQSSLFLIYVQDRISQRL
jgi:hypothetical protein